MSNHNHVLLVIIHPTGGTEQHKRRHCPSVVGHDGQPKAREAIVTGSEERGFTASLHELHSCMGREV
jgi:hypothetical protein